MHKKSQEAAAHLESVEGQEFDEDEETETIEKKVRIEKEPSVKVFSYKNNRDEYSEDETLKTNNNHLGLEQMCKQTQQRNISSLTNCIPHFDALNLNLNQVGGYQFHYNP